MEAQYEVTTPDRERPMEPPTGPAAPTFHDESHPSQGDLTQRVKEDTDDCFISTTPEQLLSYFFGRVVKHNSSSGTAVLNQVRSIVKTPCQGSILQQALNEYVNRGDPRENTAYKPLVKLCNQVLSTIRADVATKLDEVLRPEDPSHLIELVRYDTLPLVYDWLSKAKRGRSVAPRSLTLKLGILIVLKNAIKDYEVSQTSLKGHPFDPSDAPKADTNALRIRIKDVLGCVDVKWKRGPGQKRDSVQSLWGQESESSRVSGASASSLLKRKFVSSRLGAPSSQHNSSLRTPSGSHASSNAPNTHFAQLGNYACEFLSRGPYVTHNVGIKIKNDTVQFCWFDRQSTISTKEFKIVEDFDLFVASIVALSRFSLADWGIATELYPKNGWIEYCPQGNKTLRIDMAVRPICHRVTLHGRGTMVLRGKLSNGASEEPVVIKISHPEVWRLQEQSFIYEGQRTSAKDHLPIIHHAEDFGSPTSDIRIRFGKDYGKGRDRIRRIIVFEPLDDITSLTESKQVAQVWLDCLMAHHEMWEAGYEHGDVSIYNLMYRTRNMDGANKIMGVMNDWDLATSRHVRRDTAAEKGKRTGTLPFAALELVEGSDKPYTRKYRHDLESFGWCLDYICLDHPENLEFLRKWHQPSHTVDVRGNFLRQISQKKARPGFERLYKSAQVFMRWLKLEIIGSWEERDATWQEPKDSEVWKGVLKFLEGDFIENL